MLKRLLPFFPLVQKEAIAGGLLLVLMAGVEVLQPWPLKFLVDNVFGRISPPPWLALSAPWFGQQALFWSILAIALAIVILALTHKLFMLFSQQLLIRAGDKLVLALRRRACEHLLRLDLSYHDRTKVGDSLYRLAYDTTCVQTLLSQAIAPVAAGGLVLSAILLVMLKLDPLMTLLVALATPIHWAIIKVFSKVIERRNQNHQEYERALVTVATESLSSIRAVQAYGREKLVADQFGGYAAKAMNASQKLVFAQLGFSAAIGVAMAVGTAAVVYVGSLRVLEGRLTIGEVLVFLAYLGMLYTPMNAFSQSAGVIHSVKAQLGRVFELLDFQPAVTSCMGAIVPHAVRGRIEFSQVSFAYESGQEVLEKINLVVEPGQIVALVGKTGAGKSTLMSLLLRFYDPSQGVIKLDGYNLRDLNLDWLRQQISIVMQDSLLFSGTIAENIAFGCPQARAELIQQAAIRAQAHDFIAALPQGYQTMLGERGVNLSGGQRQRLAIARAFLKDAPILILDEPTSALDAHTEGSLVEAIRQLAVGHTTFIIAHRLSTVRLADRIVVLDGGRIIESGKHSELLAKETAYRRLYRAQWQMDRPG